MKKSLVTAAAGATMMAVGTVGAADVGSAGAPGLVVEIPFTVRAQHVTIPIELGGETIRMILDTGMPEGIFVMDPAIGKRAGLEYTMQVQAAGGGGGEPRPASMVMGQSFSVAGIEFADERVIVLDEPEPMLSLADGVIGMSIFERYATQIDYETQMLRLYDPETFDRDASGTAVPLTFTLTKPYATIAVDLGRGPVPVELVVDSGAGGALSLHSWSSEALSVPDGATRTLVGRGVEGDITGHMARIPALEVGGYRLENVVADFPDDESMTGLGAQSRNGTLGAEVLRRFVVTFDYAQKQMLLRPNGLYEETFEYNMAGFEPYRNGDEMLTLGFVLPGSPSDQAGLAVDDVIVAIDGRSASEWTALELRECFRAEGEEVSMTIEREGERFEVRVKLRRLI